jgi:hypothetical protein
MENIMDSKQTSATPGTDVPVVPESNPMLIDARAKIALIRSIKADFPEETDSKPLRASEMALATKTTVAFLEKSALFIEASPILGSALADAATMREAAFAELAYGGLVDEALALVRRVRTSVLRRKLKAVRAARALYKVAQGFVTSDAGDPLRPHLAEMKRTLSRRRRPAKKPTAPPAASSAATAVANVEKTE